MECTYKQLVSGSDTEPLSLAEVKQHCHSDLTDDEPYLQALISAARDYIERQYSIQVGTTTWKAAYRCFPTRAFMLPVGPVQGQSIVQVQYYDANNQLQTQTTTDWLLYDDQIGRPVLVLPEDFSAPNIYSRPDAVLVTYKAGQASVPASIKHAMKLLIGHWYRNREAATDLNMKEVPLAVSSLMDSFVLRRVY